MDKEALGDEVARRIREALVIDPARPPGKMMVLDRGAIRDACVRVLSEAGMPDVRIEIVEDTEDEALCREIMEEGRDEVRLRATVPAPGAPWLAAVLDLE